MQTFCIHPQQIIISAKLSKKDEHMAKLVQETRTKSSSGVS